MLLPLPAASEGARSKRRSPSARRSASSGMELVLDSLACRVSALSDLPIPAVPWPAQDEQRRTPTGLQTEISCCGLWRCECGCTSAESARRTICPCAPAKHAPVGGTSIMRTQSLKLLVLPRDYLTERNADDLLAVIAH